MDKIRPVSPGIRRKALVIFAAIVIAAIVISGYLYFQSPPTLSHRPQEPKGPFPYEIEDVTFTNVRENIRLSGTLTIPSNRNEKHPAVILISGYGPQNRDAEWNGHKPFLVMADCLTRLGVVVLRYDDRGCGKINGKLSCGHIIGFFNGRGKCNSVFEDPK